MGFKQGIISDEWTPDPFNIFMNVPIISGLGREEGGGKIDTKLPECEKGDFIVLRAEREVVAVVSACPNVSPSIFIALIVVLWHLRVEESF